MCVCESLGRTQRRICHWSNMLPPSLLTSLLSVEVCVCLQPSAPAAGYIRTDTCYGNNMQMGPPPPSPPPPLDFTSQSGPALHNGSPCENPHPSSSSPSSPRQHIQNFIFSLRNQKMETCGSISSRNKTLPARISENLLRKRWGGMGVGGGGVDTRALGKHLKEANTRICLRTNQNAPVVQSLFIHSKTCRDLNM